MVTAGRVDPEKVAEVLAARLGARPELLVVLGSGLSSLAEALRGASVPFGDLPGFPEATVAGHAGRFVSGSLSGRSVLAQCGRFHLYEGHPVDVVAAPVRVAHALGIRTIVLTNAAGGIGRDVGPGSIMLIEDHLSFGASPSRGFAGGGVREGMDMTAPYDAKLAALAMRCADELGIPLARGVYAWVSGPSYETPAEIRALRRLGADAVGMSTVPEVVAARALEMSCCALSLITNFAAGVAAGPLSHEDVVAVGRSAGARLGVLLERIVRDLSD